MASYLPASSPGPILRGHLHVELGQGAATHPGTLPTTFTTLNLPRRMAISTLIPVRYISQWQLVHLARLQPCRQRWPTRRFPAGHQDIRGAASGAGARPVPDSSPLAAATLATAMTGTPRRCKLAFFNVFRTPDMGNRWLNVVKVQTGIKSHPSQIMDGQAGGRIFRR